MPHAAEATPLSPGTVLATKLQPPAGRREVLRRERLLTALEGVLTHPVTLVTAPAGAGKTTLLSTWAATPLPARVAWLALDEGDDDPVVFWTCVVAALRTVWPDVGAATLAELEVRRPRLREAVVPSLLNDVAGRDGRAVLVLDDVHLLAGEALHASIAALVERLPPTLHVAIASRTEPPLPVARMRVRGTLLEVRAQDLRFDDDEAAELLNGALGLGLRPEQVRRLQRRTEGWAAGMYLAALSLRDRGDADAVIAQFSGDHRHLVDYLGGEVLAGLSPRVRGFLLRTSILSRLSAPLCDAVLETDDAAGLLDAITRTNLFLTALDDTGTWHRYHHLFAELLRHELARTLPGEAPALHLRASAWHEAHREPSEAIAHALAAGATGRARDLVAAHWNTHFNRGELDTVTRWLDALPEDDVLGEPELCVARAWLALDAGELRAVAGWIDAAERAVAGGDADAPIAARVDALHAVHDLKTGRLGSAGARASAVAERPLGGAAFAHVVAGLVLGAARHWHGDDGATEALERALALAERSGNDLAATYALGYLALRDAGTGDAWAAERRLLAAAPRLKRPAVGEHFVAAIVHLARSEVHLRRGDLAAAVDAAAASVRLADAGGGLPERAAARLALARARHARGAATGDAVEDARRILGRCPDPGALMADAEHTMRALRRSPGRRAEELGDLTDRELAVARMLRSELSYREIASALRVSRNTVKTQVRAVYLKLDATTRDEAVARGHELGLW
jgi:LuxR family maltose regulon positive regulatory protein